VRRDLLPRIQKKTSISPSVVLPVPRGTLVAFLHGKNLAMFIGMNTTRSPAEPRPPDRFD
jgi:hypothetical protein